MQEKKILGIIRHYHKPNSDHCPYNAIVKELTDLKEIQLDDKIHSFLSQAPDGSEVEFTIKIKAVHPATKGFIWCLTKPHTYERIKKERGESVHSSKQ